ncbi:hypothetical protein BV25DRAFT_1808438 [Artomyces pyxidatus]|uniref:Uncharacterized protein n=1 Tax=Artomyces pyxidatus TaxID=48021 RepID=A0ACB8ST64_9AGAM|nr:hypothetical protein BV25DRAFT_1808438 [Artomyces pyxidatus]
MSSCTVLPSSLLPRTSHSPRILELVDMPVSPSVIELVVDFVVNVVREGTRRDGRSLVTEGSEWDIRRTRFTHLVLDLVMGADIDMSCLLVCLLYLERSKARIHITDSRWPFERVFIGAVVVAHKYLNDCVWFNSHWSLFSGIFCARSITTAEREFLGVVQNRLSVTEADILGFRRDVMHGPQRQKTLIMETFFVGNRYELAVAYDRTQYAYVLKGH